MKAVRLFAKKASEQLEADALRPVGALHEGTPEKPQESIPELSARQFMMVVGLVVIVWSPIFFWMINGFPEFKKPPEDTIEQLKGFTPTQDGRWTTRTYVFARHEISVGNHTVLDLPEEKIAPVVYEDSAPLSKDRFEFQPLSKENIWRYVTIKTDGDPNLNGHKYYAVRPLEHSK